MVRLLAVITLLALTACGNGNKFEVISFESNSKGCEYRLRQPGGWIMDKEIYIVDSCGKFNVGDNLYMVK